MEQKTIYKRCPKCRSGNFNVYESVVVLDFHEVRNGIEVFADAGDPQETISVDAVCMDCEHTWRMKGKSAWNMPHNT